MFAPGGYTSRPSGACVGQGSNGTVCAVFNARTLLTAAHTNIFAGTVEVEGSNYTLSDYYNHPVADVRLLKTTSDLPRFSALPTALPSIADEIAMGGTGQTASEVGGYWTNPRSERWVRNLVHSIVSNELGAGIACVFDESGVSNEGIACLYDSGGFVGSTNGATMHAVIRAAGQPNYGRGTGATLIHPLKAWIESVSAHGNARPCVALLRFVTITETATATMRLNAAADWTGSAGDIEIVLSDGTVYRNSGGPSAGDGTTEMTFSMVVESLPTTANGTFRMNAGALEIGGNPSIACENCGYILNTPSDIGPSIVRCIATIDSDGAGATTEIEFDDSVTSGDTEIAGFDLHLPDGRIADSEGSLNSGNGTATHNWTIGNFGYGTGGSTGIDGTIRMYALYGSSGVGAVQAVSNFPVTWSATAVTAASGWLAPVSVADDESRYRQFTATGAGRKRIVLKSTATATAYEIIVWQIFGDAVIRVGSSESAACEFDGVDGQTYLVCMFNRSGSTATVGFDVSGAPPDEPSAPTPATAARITPTRRTLSWTAATGATSYNVYIKPVGGEFTLIGNTASTSITATGLSPSTAYQWRVDPVNSAGTTTGPTWGFTTGGY